MKSSQSSEWYRICILKCLTGKVSEEKVSTCGGLMLAHEKEQKSVAPVEINWNLKDAFKIYCWAKKQMGSIYTSTVSGTTNDTTINP